MRTKTRASTADQSPEWDRLVALVRDAALPCHRHDTHGAQQIQVDGGRLLALARHHGVTGLLAKAVIIDGSPTALSATTRQSLHRRLLSNTARNAILASVMFETLGHLESAGIRALPFKGLPLAQMLYGDVATRTMVDIDFLVTSLSLAHVKEVLLTAGCRPVFDLKPAEQRAHLRSGWELQLRHGETACLLEFSSGVSARHYGFNRFDASVMANQRTVCITGQTVETLSPDAHFFVLCVHGTKHYWSRLAWIMDIAILLASPGMLDPARILSWAQACGAVRMVYLACAMAASVSGVAIPDTLAQGMASDPTVDALRAYCEGQLLANEGTPAPKNMRVDLRVRERRRDRLRYMVDLAVTPSYSDWRSIRLPAALFPLYYGIRPIRLLSRGIKRIAGRTLTPHP